MLCWSSRRFTAGSWSELCRGSCRGFRCATGTAKLALPVVDISPLRHRDASASSRAAVGEDIDAALRSAGFMYVSGHGVDTSLLTTVRNLAADFFSLMEAEKRIIQLRGAQTGYRGYQPMEMNVTKGAPDLHEGIDFYKDVLDVTGEASIDANFRGPNLWPDDVELLHNRMAQMPTLLAGLPNNVLKSCGDQSSFRSVYQVYIQEMLTLGLDIMAGVEIGLGLPPRSLAGFYDRSFWAMRAIHYPASPEAHNPDSVGCGEHTDYGNLTVITADDGPGLEACLEVRDLDGRWMPVPPLDGTLVVNIGDMLAHWTGVYRSTPHRVIAPQRDALGSNEAKKRGRISVAFFFEPNYDAIITPLRAPNDGCIPERLHYGEHLSKKVTNNFAES